MPEVKESIGKYVLIGLTAIASLVVGVSSGLLLDFFRERPATLTYTIATSESFVGRLERIGIAVVTVSNSGRKEAEDILCRLAFKGATIKEQRVVGLPTAAATVQPGNQALELRVPYLNPQESFSFHVLLALQDGGVTRPAVELRGKGSCSYSTSGGNRIRGLQAVSDRPGSACPCFAVTLLPRLPTDVRANDVHDTAPR